MRKANLLFVVLTLILMAYAFYLVNYADGGADGLSNFFPLVIALILSLGCLIGFFVSLFLQRETSNLQKTLLAIAALIVVIGFLASIGLLGNGNADYEVEVQEQVE